jgi:hypothetical protein
LCALSFLHKMGFKLLSKFYHLLILHMKYFLHTQLSWLNQISYCLDCNIRGFRFNHEPHSLWINLNLTYRTTLFNAVQSDGNLLLTQDSCQREIWCPRQRHETFIFDAWLQIQDNFLKFCFSLYTAFLTTRNDKQFYFSFYRNCILRFKNL